MSDTQQFKTVARFNDRLQADFCVALLGDHGIPAGVFGADSAQPFVNLGIAIEVKVNADDYDEAMSILAASDKAE